MDPLGGLVGVRLVEGQGTPHSVPYPRVRRRWCRFGVSLRAWVGAWCLHSGGQPGRQGWQQRPAAWGLPGLRPHLRRRGLSGRRGRGGEGRTPGLAATEATWPMGRGLQGLGQAGSATSLASHHPRDSGVCPVATWGCSEARRLGFQTGGMCWRVLSAPGPPCLWPCGPPFAFSSSSPALL